jgi:hypothetical protein
MSCDFTVYWIQVPQDKISEINGKLFALDIADFLVIEEVKGKFFLQETESEVSHSTASDITDRWFPELAKLLNGTPQDGQIIETRYESEDTYYLIANGESKQLDNFIQEFTPETPIPVGTIVEANLKVKIVGLMDGRAGVLEFVFTKK